MDANTGLTEFERDLLESVRQAKTGEFAAVHTPAQITARKRGRPVGAVATTRKVSTTIRLGEDVLTYLRATGRGWQTRIDALIREAVAAGRV